MPLKLLAVVLALAVLAGPRPAQADGGLQTAVASSYGPGLYGARTAWGWHCTDWDDPSPWAVISSRSHGVANKTLPLGSWVRIVVGNGSYTLPVIDRGPYVWGWSFDITEPQIRRMGYADSYDWGHRTIRWEPLPENGIWCPGMGHEIPTAFPPEPPRFG